MHLSTDDLRLWRDGQGSDRDRIVAHLATCDDCGARLAELLRTAPACAAPTAFDVGSFRRAGSRAGAKSDRGPRAVWTYAPALAAAAALLLAVLYVALPDRPGGPVFRGDGAEIRLVRPAGTVARADLVFEWTGPDGAYTLRVVDLDAPGAPVLARDDVRTGYTPTSDERAQFRPGVTYRWFVEQPEAGVASPSGRFTVR